MLSIQAFASPWENTNLKRRFSHKDWRCTMTSSLFTVSSWHTQTFDFSTHSHTLWETHSWKILGKWVPKFSFQIVNLHVMLCRVCPMMSDLPLGPTVLQIRPERKLSDSWSQSCSRAARLSLPSYWRSNNAMARHFGQNKEKTHKKHSTDSEHPQQHPTGQCHVGVFFWEKLFGGGGSLSFATQDCTLPKLPPLFPPFFFVWHARTAEPKPSVSDVWF